MSAVDLAKAAAQRASLKSRPAHIGLVMKICSKCKETKQESEFGKMLSGKNGLNSQCKKCRSEYEVAWRIANQDKVIAAYAAYAAINREKLRIIAKNKYEANPEISRAYSAAYRASNPEKTRASVAAWRAANPEKALNAEAKYRENNKHKIKESYTAWRAKNPDYGRAYRIENKERINAWYSNNKEKRAAQASAWYEANKERVLELRRWRHLRNPNLTKIYNSNSRARKLANGGKLSKDLAAKLFKIQRGKCACCGKALGKNYHLDHIMPLALGGANEDWNIQLLTQRCNNQKHMKHPIDFMKSRGFLL